MEWGLKIEQNLITFLLIFYDVPVLRIEMGMSHFFKKKANMPAAMPIVHILISSSISLH